jgi:hypothetical protein
MLLEALHRKIAFEQNLQSLAATAGSTIIERGEKTRTKAESRPNLALSKRTIQPYQSFRLLKIPTEASAKVETPTEGG